MSAEPVPSEPEARPEYAGVLRFYHLAKHQEWQVDDVPWGEIPFVPEGKGAPERQTRRRDIWRSVIMQQLQADVFACEMAAQLLSAAPDPEATPLLLDDGAGRVAPHRGVAAADRPGRRGGGARPVPRPARAHVPRGGLLEEKVFLMQVFFERLIIPRFRLIAKSSRGTVLEDLCNRLAIDDGIHHGAGMAYERVLLQSAGKKVRARLVEAANTMLPVFAQHVLWRPKAREVIGTLMESRDRERLREELNHGVRLANSLGLDVSDVRLAGRLARGARCAREFVGRCGGLCCRFSPLILLWRAGRSTISFFDLRVVNDTHRTVTIQPCWDLDCLDTHGLHACGHSRPAIRSRRPVTSRPTAEDKSWWPSGSRAASRGSSLRA